MNSLHYLTPQELYIKRHNHLTHISSVALRPELGLSLLIDEVSISHTRTAVRIL
jgi:hypothetical protein